MPEQLERPNAVATEAPEAVDAPDIAASERRSSDNSAD
jgi:hypothetical protein